MKEMLFYIFIACLVSVNEAARILAVFPYPAISHQAVFRPYTQELAKRGHELVVVTTDPAFPSGKTPTNFTEIDIHDVSYKVWKNEFVKSSITQGGKDWYSQVGTAFKITTSLFETQMSQDEVKNVIFDDTKKFDLLIVEACVLVALGLSHIHKVPVIQISSFGPLTYNLNTVGAPMHIYVHPTSIQQKVFNLSLMDKIDELYAYYRVYNVLQEVEEDGNNMLKRLLGPNTPSLNELNNNVDFLFLNIHPVWETNRPVPPNVVYMGGLHQKPGKELPADIQSYLDSSENGVIYFSFGTNVDPSLFPSERIKILINVFSKLKYNTLWKWSSDDLPGHADNIKFLKWLPQSDVLRHPNVKLFITQAGLQSTDEAITAGVPMLGIPVLGDQWYNADMYEYHKIGKRINLEDINEDALYKAIITITEDRSYRQNLMKLREIILDEPQKPLERAVWWTEYLLRHGNAKHLRPPSANISWTRYLELELVCIVVAALFTSLFILFVTVYNIYKYVFKSSSKIKRKMK